MKVLRILAALTVIAFLLPIHTSCTHQRGPVSASWYEGAAGYDRAWPEWQESHAPALIYFYTDWCRYCKEFERELLSSNEVKEYLQGVVKVRINPEDGSQDQKVAQMFGVTGYPAIFLIPSGASKPIRLSRYKKAGDESALMSPTEFVRACRARE
jgi:thiol:disulfide interchange protein